MKSITYSVTEKFPNPIPVEEAKAILTELGFDKNDIAWRKKYISLRAGAPQRGHICYLTFKEYMKLAKKAGLTSSDEVGVGLDKYQMSRNGDTGNYEWGNCKFLTQEQNLRAKHKNGGYARQAEAQSRAFRVISPTGRVHTGKNIREFCRKHELNPSKLSRVCRGVSSNHRGWRGVYRDG